jgi:hypothetical protein
VNLYVAGEARLQIDDGVTVKLAQETDYPWDGRVRLTVTPDPASEFTLCLRIPGWALGRPVPSDLYRFADPKVPPVTLKINGQAADPTPRSDGYVHLQRHWQAGDAVELNLPMPVHRVLAHEKVQDDQGKVALMRGPLVYCLEGVDHDFSVSSAVLPESAQITAEHRNDLLGGVTVLRGQALADSKRPAAFTAVPYYSWQNRGKSEMTVWILRPPNP